MADFFLLEPDLLEDVGVAVTLGLPELLPAGSRVSWTTEYSAKAKATSAMGARNRAGLRRIANKSIRAPTPARAGAPPPCGRRQEAMRPCSGGRWRSSARP